MSIIKKIIFITMFLLALAGVAVANDQSPHHNVQEEQNRATVIRFYNHFFNNHQLDEAYKILSHDYKQHNPYVADGIKPFISYFKEFFKQNPQSSARIVRTSVDGDLVWLHVHAKNNLQDPGRAVVDIFRVNQGKIVEHWDVIQDVPAATANMNTMF